MKKTFITFLLIFTVLISAMPIIALAVENEGGPQQPAGKTIDLTLTNPLNLPDDATLIDLLNMLIDGLMYIAIPVIVILLIYTGLKFVMARGNSTEIAAAKQMFFYIIVGTAIILGSKLLVEIVKNTMEAFSAPATEQTDGGSQGGTQ